MLILFLHVFFDPKVVGKLRSWPYHSSAPIYTLLISQPYRYPDNDHKDFLFEIYTLS